MRCFHSPLRHAAVLLVATMLQATPGQVAAGTVDPATDPNAALGLGYDTIKGEVKGECVAGTEDGGNDQGEKQLFSLLQVETSNQLRELLSISASASITASSGQGQGKANLLSSIQISNYSLYLLASVLVEQAPRRWAHPSLTSSASTLLSSKGAEQFRRRCGDQYISGWITGGEYHAIIEISTSSSDDMRSVGAQISGSMGEYSAASDLASSLEQISKNNQIRVYVYTSGGVGLAVATYPKQMIDDAKTFAGKLSGNAARRIVAITQSYDTLDLPDGPTPMDVARQVATIDQLSSLGLSLRDYVTNIEYVLSHQAEFKAPDVAALNSELASLNGVQAKIAKAVDGCYNDVSACGADDPGIAIPAVQLPERFANAVQACADPLFNEKADQACGVEAYATGRDQVCGVDSYAEGKGPVCGAASYVQARSSACGAESYVVAGNPKCGRVDTLVCAFCTISDIQTACRQMG